MFSWFFSDQSVTKLLATCLAGYKADLQQWQKNKKNNTDAAPEEPQRPICRRAVVNDATIEAVAARLKDNPRGLLLKMDELSGHFGGMNQYRAGGKGNDEAKWLSMHGAREIIIDRKSAEKPTIAIRRAPVSIIGGIQPAILQRSLGREQFENGMAARFLLVNPPAKVSRWTDDVVPDDLETAFADLVFKLHHLEYVTNDDELCPVFVPLNQDARHLFTQFSNEHAEETAGLTGALSAAWSKLEGCAARLALIIQFAKWAQGDSFDQPGCIDLESMQAGIDLVRWFGHETRRNYSQFSETPDQRQRRDLLELIQRHGGEITPRDLTRSSRRYATSDIAEQALQQLVAEDLGTWLTITTAGPTSRRFALRHVVDDASAKPER